jgi:exopolysaccharide biosynthesis polyprenyl glycosylphosphotransferase
VQRTKTNALRSLHLLLDAAVIVLSMVLAAGLHSRLREAFPAVKTLVRFQEYAVLVYFALPLFLGLVVIFRLNRSFEEVPTTGSLLLGMLKLHLLGFVGLALIDFLARTTVNRSLVACFLTSTFALMYGTRTLLNRWVRYQHRQGHAQRRLLLVGRESRRMADFARDALAEPLPPRILGFLSSSRDGNKLSVPPPNSEPLRSIGTLSPQKLADVLRDEAVDEVLFFPPENDPEELGEYVSICEELGISAGFSVSLVQVARAAPQISSIHEHPFVTFNVAPKQPEWLAVKHGLDPILAAVLLLALAPVFAVTALAILITMGRPVFFNQQRAGLFGRPFSMFKFRSMVAGAEAKRDELQAFNEMSGPVFKVANDPRVTRLGRFLRRTSIDELPQLVNVLFGSMTLVGPRPLPLSEQSQIRNWQRRRLSMKPGITCLWQVKGRSQLDFDEWMALDLKYIDEWSLTLDIVILLRTIPEVLFGRGAH